MNIEYANDQAYQRWKKWMELGSRTGCHQRADRSFFVKGYQMPVCARCTGAITGYMAAIPGYFLLGFSKLITAAGITAMAVDWFIQTAGIKESTNRRRVITGILGGYGIMSLQLHFIRKAVKALVKLKKHK